MAKYIFYTNEFGISENGIHLLRSGFNYQTISFEEIEKLEIGKGKELNNWWLILIIGIGLTWLGIFLSIGIIRALIDGGLAPRNARMIFVLLIPVLGGYFVFNSLQTGLVLKVHCIRGNKKVFPIRKIIKERKLQDFRSYLIDKLGVKFQFLH